VSEDADNTIEALCPANPSRDEEKHCRYWPKLEPREQATTLQEGGKVTSSIFGKNGNICIF
jgi:hypothetical protein